MEVNPGCCLFCFFGRIFCTSSQQDCSNRLKLGGLWLLLRLVTNFWASKSSAFSFFDNWPNGASIIPDYTIGGLQSISTLRKVIQQEAKHRFTLGIKALASLKGFVRWFLKLCSSFWPRVQCKAKCFLSNCNSIAAAKTVTKTAYAYEVSIARQGLHWIKSKVSKKVA